MTDHVRVRAVVVEAEYACDVCWSVDFGVLGYRKLVDRFGRKEKEYHLPVQEHARCGTQLCKSDSGNAVNLLLCPANAGRRYLDRVRSSCKPGR